MNDILDKLYREKSKIIYGYLIKRGCSKEEAEDILQDSFVKAIEYIDSVSPNKFQSWLFTVSINNYNNHVKRKNIIKQVNIENEDFYNLLASENETEIKIVKMEKMEDVKVILNGIKEIYKILLIMKYDMDLSYDEIGDILDMNENTVKTYLYRARNEFKRIWREKDEERLWR